jgi:hypothetical protein
VASDPLDTNIDAARPFTRRSNTSPDLTDGDIDRVLPGFGSSDDPAEGEYDNVAVSGGPVRRCSIAFSGSSAALTPAGGVPVRGRGGFCAPFGHVSSHGKRGELCTSPDSVTGPETS